MWYNKYEMFSEKLSSPSFPIKNYFSFLLIFFRNIQTMAKIITLELIYQKLIT